MECCSEYEVACLAFGYTPIMGSGLDRRGHVKDERGLQMQNHERKAKRGIEKAGFICAAGCAMKRSLGKFRNDLDLESVAQLNQRTNR